MKRKRIKGFTLIELIVAIAIISIISVICFVFVSTIISNAKKDAQISNTKILSKIVKETLEINDIQNNDKLDSTKYFVIQNNFEYMLDKDGTRIPTNYFNYNGQYCDFCVIKVNPDKDAMILLEGEEYDIKKDFDSNVVYSESLIVSREISSLYNELAIFKDIYVSNNTITETKRFTFENGIIYEQPNDGPKFQVFKLRNKTQKGKIQIFISKEAEYIVNKDNDIITINDNGDYEEEENVNSGYSDNILALYDEIKFVAERYIRQNNISQELYFEFDGGKINKIDAYGNSIFDSTLSMNSSVMGSGELRINTSGQYEITIYDNDDNIKNIYGSDKLNREALKFTRDVTILFRNLGRLELLAEKYTNGATDSNYKPSKSDWLVFYYIRQFKYTGSNWNTVSNSDSAFVTYVTNNGAYLKDYFRNKNTFIVNEDTIDLKHMAAVFATCMYQTADGVYAVLSQTTVDSVASWAGDLQTFMVDNLLPTVTNKTVAGYKAATLELLGKSNTSFNMDDIYADTDAWIINYNLKSKTTLNIPTAFEQFYSGTSTRSYKNRFTSFKNTVLGSSNGTKDAFKNLVYKFTKQNYEVDIVITLTKKWPLYGSHTISSAMSQGVRDGFVEWIWERIDNE